jgi:hypothetical protein
MIVNRWLGLAGKLGWYISLIFLFAKNNFLFKFEEELFYSSKMKNRA